MVTQAATLDNDRRAAPSKGMNRNRFSHLESIAENPTLRAFEVSREHKTKL
jgi:hypothetical protein